MAHSKKTGVQREDEQRMVEGPGAQAASRTGLVSTEGAAHEQEYMAVTTRGVGGIAVSATRDVVRGAIGVTEDVATGLVGGVTHVAAELIHGVRDLGYEVTDSANGLIGAAGTVGGTAVHTVADLLTDVVGGVRQVIGAAMGRDGNGHYRSLDRHHAAIQHAEPADTASPRAASGAERPAAPPM